MDCYNIFGHLGMYQKLRKFISVYQTNIQKETIKESRHSEDTPSNNQAIWFTKSLLDQNSMAIPTTKPYMNLFFLSPFLFTIISFLHTIYFKLRKIHFITQQDLQIMLNNFFKIKGPCLGMTVWPLKWLNLHLASMDAYPYKNH